MPHIVLCSRYWRFAGDELPVSGVCSIIGRLILITCVAVVYNVTANDARSCHSGLNAYLIASLVVFCGSILLEILIVRAGLQGTMVEMVKRRDELEKLLICHYAFSVVQFALTIWGCFLVAHTWNIPCASDVLEDSLTDKALLAVVVTFQIFDILSQFFCCFLLKAGSAKGRHRSDSLHSLSGQEKDDSPVQSVLHGSVSPYAAPNSFESDDQDYDSEAQKRWEKRCSYLCNCTRFFSCGIFGGSNIAQDIEAVAKVLTTFFQHDGFLDVVPSDVLAGILLVRLQQRRTLVRYYAGSLSNADNYVLAETDLEVGDGLSGRRQLSASLPTRTRLAFATPRRQMDPLRLDDAECIRTLTRMSQFAFAVYTHLLYLYDRPITGLCKLCYSCCAGDACKVETSVRGLMQPPRSAGDNCCHINHAAATAVVQEMGNAEVIYATYVNDLVLKPYVIFLDHDTENVVIALRGTLSLEDCLTDAICEPADLSEAGEAWGFDGKGRWAHGGMLRSAQAIRSDISRQGILSAIFSGFELKNLRGNHGSTLQSADRASVDSVHSLPGSVQAAYPHYGLKVVGHSLGAGTAAILSLLLRAEYPTLSCCGFGMPGSVLDRRTATESHDWLTSVVLDNDIVCRLGLSTLNHLREEVLRSITRAKINKTHIMRTLVEELDVNDVMYAVGQEPASAFKDAVDAFLEHMRKKNESAGAVHELVLPGRIVTLVKEKRGMQPATRSACTSLCRGIFCCCRPRKKHVYIAQETTSDAFSEIAVSPSMAIDHFPDRYVQELQALKERWEDSSF